MNNPPAFPNDVKPINERAGMTLRDYFAAKAMQAFMTAWITENKYPETDFEVAEYSYAMADAMLKAR